MQHERHFLERPFGLTAGGDEKGKDAYVIKVKGQAEAAQVSTLQANTVQQHKLRFLEYSLLLQSVSYLFPSPPTSVISLFM